MFNNRILYWIAIDIANQAGHDKLKFEERIQFVEYYMQAIQGFKSPLRSFYIQTQNTKEIEKAFNALQLSIMNNPIVINGKNIDFSSPDSIWGFKNAVHALYRYIDDGYANHMVYLDASNQALQLYAVVTRDLQTAKTCNLANGSHMADAYQMLADALNAELNTTFTRKNCKKALMTQMYSKSHAWTEILEDRYVIDFATKLKAEFDITEEQLSIAYYKALKNIAPKALVAMDALKELNDEYVGTYYWTAEDGFNVKYDVKVRHSVMIEMKTKYDLNYNDTFSGKIYGPSEINRGMAPNIIHSIDGYVAREMIRRMNGKFITTIHDAFACHPMDCDLMIQNYKDILIEILESNILSEIITEIASVETTFNYSTDLLKEHIQNSVYLLS